MKAIKVNTFRARWTRMTQGPFDRRALLMVGAGLAVALVGLTIMLITGAFSGLWGAQQTPTPAGLVASQTPLTARVVVAVVDISTSTIMTDSQLRVLDYPLELAPPDALHDVGDAAGKSPSEPILAGQIVLSRQLEALPQALQDNTGRRVGDAAQELPEDKVLAAFPATDLLNSTGAVQAGDHVDLLLSIPYSAATAGQTPEQGGKSGDGATSHLVSQVTLQDVTVFNVGSWQPAAGQGQAQTGTQSVSGAPTTGAPAAPAVGTGPSVITFIVSPQDALVLKYVKDSGGSVDMVIRSSSNTKKTSTDPVDSQYIIEHFGFK